MKSNLFQMEEDENEQQQKVKEIGEVKKGFTFRVDRSDVLKRAELFLPMLGLSNKYVERGSCDPVIEEVHENENDEITFRDNHSDEIKEVKGMKEVKEKRGNEMEEDEEDEEKEEDCYVEMNVALGVLEEKNDENEEESEDNRMIEELN